MGHNSSDTTRCIHFTGLVVLWRNSSFVIVLIPRIICSSWLQETVSVGNTKPGSLAIINGSWSLLWRKNCSFIFTAVTRKMVKKGNLYFLIVSSFPMMIQCYFGQVPCRLCSAAQSWHPRAAVFSPPEVLSPCSEMPQTALKGMDGVNSGLALARSVGKKVMKVRKGRLRYIGRTTVSSMYPTYKPSSSVKRSKIVVCFGAMFFLPMGWNAQWSEFAGVLFLSLLGDEHSWKFAM